MGPVGPVSAEVEGDDWGPGRMLLPGDWSSIYCVLCWLLSIWVCGDHRSRFHFLGFLCWMGICSLVSAFSLSSGLCGLWLSRGSPLELGAGLLVSSMVACHSGGLCLSWGQEPGL